MGQGGAGSRRGRGSVVVWNKMMMMMSGCGEVNVGMCVLEC